jgi:hypothetical protein
MGGLYPPLHFTLTCDHCVNPVDAVIFDTDHGAEVVFKDVTDG